MPEMDVSTVNTQHSELATWQAKLRLVFTQDEAITRLTERQHHGPLRVQKALYPEAPSICHAIIVHPPGGIVGGDQLQVQVQVQAGAHAVLSSPGASKWYRANGRSSAQTLHFDIADDAQLEWFPQETIFYDAAEVTLNCSVQLGHNARYLGCEILCFGRRLSGEKFSTGQIRQQFEIRQAGKLLWLECGTINANSEMVRSKLGLQNKSVCATMIAVGQQISAAQLDALRQAAKQSMAEQREQGQAEQTEQVEFGVTQMKTVTVVRYLGNNSEVARSLMMLAWRHLRPTLMGHDSHDLRIWNT
jgi:urease accessory protein